MDNPIKKYKISVKIQKKREYKKGGQPAFFQWIKKWNFCGNVEK